MITQQTILTQIEKLTTEARQATSEQQVREKFAAIKAICDVVLAENRTERQQSVNIAPNVMPVPAFTQPVAIPSQKLQEDDANGDSLFEF